MAKTAVRNVDGEAETAVEHWHASLSGICDEASVCDLVHIDVHHDLVPDNIDCHLDSVGEAMISAVGEAAVDKRYRAPPAMSCRTTHSGASMALPSSCKPGISKEQA
jgi:hypothetical protein